MWRMICEERGAKFTKVKIPLPYQGSEEIVKLFKDQLDSSVKVITFPHISAATAQVFPVRDLVCLAKSNDSISIIDADVPRILMWSRVLKQYQILDHK